MSDKSLPPSEPFPGSRTPGWNDPPTIVHSAGSTNRPRVNLNKRVAFPLQGTRASESNVKPTAIVQPNQQSNSSAPPLMMSLPPLTQPIAVVHPMPIPNVNLPPQVSTLQSTATEEVSSINTGSIHHI